MGACKSKTIINKYFKLDVDTIKKIIKSKNEVKNNSYSSGWEDVSDLILDVERLMKQSLDMSEIKLCRLVSDGYEDKYIYRGFNKEFNIEKELNKICKKIFQQNEDNYKEWIEVSGVIGKIKYKKCSICEKNKKADSNNFPIDMKIKSRLRSLCRECKKYADNLKKNRFF